MVFPITWINLLEAIIGNISMVFPTMFPFFFHSNYISHSIPIALDISWVAIIDKVIIHSPTGSSSNCASIPQDAGTSAGHGWEISINGGLNGKIIELNDGFSIAMVDSRVQGCVLTYGTNSNLYIIYIYIYIIYIYIYNIYICFMMFYHYFAMPWLW